MRGPAATTPARTVQGMMITLGRLERGIRFSAEGLGRREVLLGLDLCFCGTLIFVLGCLFDWDKEGAVDGVA